MTTDVILNKTKGYWDFEWTESGDISTGQTLDTFILLCLLEIQRATPSEVPEANLRRGWAGNESTPGFEQGSKVWLFEQERVTGTMLAELGVVVRNCLQPLLTYDLADDVQVGAPRLRGTTVVADITLFRSGSIVSQKTYTLWDNTGNF